MKTLLYLASGPYNPIYEKLDFERVILIDREFTINRINRPLNSKVELIQMDALPGIKKLKDQGVTNIDCLVSVNEGLFGGNGDYPIFSDFLLGYLSPILADKLLVITDINYYKAAMIGDKVARMDWGFKPRKILRDNPLFIDPRQFTYMGEKKDPDYGNDSNSDPSQYPNDHRSREYLGRGKYFRLVGD
jgi:hypothetical protein